MEYNPTKTSETGRFGHFFFFFPIGQNSEICAPSKKYRKLAWLTWGLKNCKTVYNMQANKNYHFYLKFNPILENSIGMTSKHMVFYKMQYNNRLVVFTYLPSVSMHH